MEKEMISDEDAISLVEKYKDNYSRINELLGSNFSLNDIISGDYEPPIIGTLELNFELPLKEKIGGNISVLEFILQNPDILKELGNISQKDFISKIEQKLKQSNAYQDNGPMGMPDINLFSDVGTINYTICHLVYLANLNKQKVVQKKETGNKNKFSERFKSAIEKIKILLSRVTDRRKTR